MIFYKYNKLIVNTFMLSYRLDYEVIKMRVIFVKVLNYYSQPPKNYRR
jgi:hypothetical protein